MEATIPLTRDDSPTECANPPALTPAHRKRLKTVFARGTRAHVSELGGIDLDLMVHGLFHCDRHDSSGLPLLTVTRRGLAYLSEARQAVVQSQSAHHDLGSRLCTYLKRRGFFTWENIEFANPDWSQPRSWGVVRPDVYACLPTLKARSAAPAIYEVKVSRADFLADLAKPEKRAAYADLAEAVYYCCPAGLIEKAEVPEGFGLVWELESGDFKIERNARRRKGFEIHADIAMTLMVKRQGPAEPGAAED